MQREKQRERERVLYIYAYTVYCTCALGHDNLKTRHSPATIASIVINYNTITILSMNGSKHFEAFRTISDPGAALSQVRLSTAAHRALHRPHRSAPGPPNAARGDTSSHPQRAAASTAKSTLSPSPWGCPTARLPSRDHGIQH